MPIVYEDAEVHIELLGPLGSYGNNAYIVRPVAGGPVAVIDAPEGSEAVVAALAGRDVSHIVVTHSHFDHWAGFDVLRAATDAPVYASADETNLEASRQVEPLADGASLRFGGVTLRVIHTPGHTPGSICLLVGDALLTGDTLFPGGPGRTGSAENLAQEIESIVSKLYTLPDDTLVLPGHGDRTTIGASKAEYADYASRPHDAGLHGDVLWATS